MRINSNGSVGIGTSAPVAPLDVEVHGAATGTNQLIAKFGRNSNIPEIEFNDELLTFGLTTGATMTFDSTRSPKSSATEISPFCRPAKLASALMAADFLEFFTGGDLVNPKLHLDIAGSLGVGTTTPKHKLDVNGNLFMGTQANGQVFAELADTIYLGSSRKYLSNTLGAKSQ